MTVKIIKKLKYHVEITFNDNFYKIERVVAHKYNLKEGASFTKLEFEKILADNEYYYYDRFSKTKLKRMLTEHELRTILMKEGAKESLIEQLITTYRSFNYLNDDYYIKTFIEQRGNREGPKILKAKLINKGLSSNLVDSYLNEYNERDNLEKIVESMLKTLKGLNKTELKQRIVRNLLRKGFSFDLVSEVVNEKLVNINVDEEKLILKELNQQLKRYQNKLSGYELKQTIKQKLYQKGYNMTLINKVVDNL